MSYSAKRFDKRRTSRQHEDKTPNTLSYNERKQQHEQRQPDWFPCVHCGQPIVNQATGTEHRNHCPSCLWSKHLDDEPGDRAADCGGAMEPVAVWSRPGGDWAIIHRCRTCGTLKSNRIAGDDNEIVLVALATRPIALSPFPLNRLRAVAERDAAQTVI